MRLNKEARKLSRQLFKSSFVNGQLDLSRASLLVSKVSEAKPRNYLPALKNFLNRLRLEDQRSLALVESAIELDPDSRSSVEGNIHKRFGGHITAEFKVNPALLGGLRIQVGSDVWDGSILNRLDRLQKQL